MNGIYPECLFINIQPSSFDPDSYPIEVGHASCAMVACAYLVRPAADWQRPSLLQEAERGPGISFLDAQTTGRPTAEVASALNADFRNKRVFSARPEWDAYWLRRLHRAAGVPQDYLVSDWADLFATLPDRRLHTREGVDRLREGVRRLADPGFRAARAARYLAAVWMCGQDPKLLGALARRQAEPVAA